MLVYILCISVIVFTSGLLGAIKGSTDGLIVVPTLAILATAIITLLVEVS